MSEKPFPTLAERPAPQYPTRATVLRTPDPDVDGSPLFALDFEDWPGAPEVFARYRAGEDLAVSPHQDYGEANDVPVFLFSVQWESEDVGIHIAVPTAQYLGELREAARKNLILLTTTAEFDKIAAADTGLTPLPGGATVASATPSHAPEDRAVIGLRINGPSLTRFLDTWA